MGFQELGSINMPFVPDPVGKFVPHSPEQGNMYTQGAEDIQYSPEGIPLNTSSYGSVNPYEKTTKALNTTVSVPLNIATGAAKLPAALVQAYDKYLGGGNTGDNMVNTINQIESGSQDQAGNVGKRILQGSSIVGEAAPYLMSPVKAGAPTFIETYAAKAAPEIAKLTPKIGEIADQAIGMLPSFAQKALPNAKLTTAVGKNMATGGAIALTSPEEAGLTPEQFEQAKADKIKSNMIFNGAMPILSATGSKLVSALRGDHLSPQMQNAVLEARNAGYTVPPTQAGGGIFNRLLEGIAGKASTLQEASVRNQNVTNNLAVKSLGLPENTVLTPEVLSSIRDDASKAYEALKALPKKPAVLADSTMNRAAVGEINPAKMVEDLKIARKDAEGYYNAYARSAHPEDLAKAKAFRSKATELEDSLENYAKEMGKEDLVPALRDARQLIAKTYTVENAMNNTTGTIDAREFAKRLQKGKPMNEELLQIGRFAQAFPKAAQIPEKIGGTIGISPLDATAAGLTFGGSLLNGEDKSSSAVNAAMALALRPAARKLVLSAPMQNKLVSQQFAPIGPVKPPLVSSDEAANLAKLLIMQRSSSKSENTK